MKKHKAQLILVGGLVLIGLLLFVASRIGRDDGPAQRAMVISIKDSGFVPADATIETGTTVTWINEGERLHVVAANPYKENSDLPGLVSEPIKPKDTYSFTFNESGTFGYHDELDPRTNGQVVVK